MVRIPARLPVTAGVKVTKSEQLAPAATLPRQLSVSAKSEAFVPLIAMLGMLSAVEALFVNVTVSADIPLLQRVGLAVAVPMLCRK